MIYLEKLLRSKVAVWTLLVLPGLWPLWPIFVRADPSVTADALKYLLHHFGFVACVVLVVALVVEYKSEPSSFPPIPQMIHLVLPFPLKSA